LRGGGAPGDFAGLPAARLAVLPGTMHMTFPGRTAWLQSMITEFLDAPMPVASSAPRDPFEFMRHGDGQRA
jgi:hypothetical protein